MLISSRIEKAENESRPFFSQTLLLIDALISFISALIDIPKSLTTLSIVSSWPSTFTEAWTIPHTATTRYFCPVSLLATFCCTFAPGLSWFCHGKDLGLGAMFEFCFLRGFALSGLSFVPELLRRIVFQMESDSRNKWSDYLLTRAQRGKNEASEGRKDPGG